MPTVQQNIGLIRMLLDYPSAQRPSDPMIFELFSNQVQHHISQLQNSASPWSVADFPLTAAANVEEYPVPVTDFGKPFMVYSEDASQPYRPRIEIPFCLLQNADQFYQGPPLLYPSADNQPRAAVMSFYKRPDGYYLRITPIPGGYATYRIWYETEPSGPASLGDNPGVSAFHHLIRVQTAAAALPYSAWGLLAVDAADDKHVKRWETKCKALGAVLAKQEGQFQRQFDTYIGSLMQAGLEARDGWGDEYMSDGGNGGYILGP